MQQFAVENRITNIHLELGVDNDTLCDPLAMFYVFYIYICRTYKSTGMKFGAQYPDSLGY